MLARKLYIGSSVVLILAWVAWCVSGREWESRDEASAARGSMRGVSQASSSGYQGGK